MDHTSALGESLLFALHRFSGHRARGDSGIYFITLESDNRLATLVTIRFFRLPYRNAVMTTRQTPDSLEFNHRRGAFHAGLKLQAKQTTVFSDSPLSQWATDRHRLYTVKDDRVYRGVVRDEGNFLELVPGAQAFALAGASHARTLNVSFKPFERLA